MRLCQFGALLLFVAQGPAICLGRDTAAAYPHAGAARRRVSAMARDPSPPGNSLRSVDRKHEDRGYRGVKQAIVSDIHGNLEALTAVLADARQQGAARIICLGDLIGYGPNPRECIDIALDFDVCILGNHDVGALFDPEGFSSGAERAIFWTRNQLEGEEGDVQGTKRRLNFLAERPRSHRENGFMFVHGSARNPLNEYVFPEDAFNTRKISKIFAVVEHVSFQGHTHVPGVFTEQSKFFSPSELDGVYVLGTDKCMINVGSVGQPRDGNPRSCYVLMEDNVINFRRVSYPWEETVKKIHAVPQLDNFLGDRLREGC